MNKRLIILLLPVLLLVCRYAAAQQKALQQQVNLPVTGLSMDMLARLVYEQTGYQLSYNAGQVRFPRPVQFDRKQYSLGELLDLVKKNTNAGFVVYKQHIILKKNKLPLVAAPSIILQSAAGTAVTKVQGSSIPPSSAAVQLHENKDAGKAAKNGLASNAIPPKGTPGKAAEHTTQQQGIQDKKLVQKDQSRGVTPGESVEHTAPGDVRLTDNSGPLNGAQENNLSLPKNIDTAGNTGQRISVSDLPKGKVEGAAPLPPQSSAATTKTNINNDRALPGAYLLQKLPLPVAAARNQQTGRGGLITQPVMLVPRAVAAYDYEEPALLLQVGAVADDVLYGGVTLMAGYRYVYAIGAWAQGAKAGGFRYGIGGTYPIGDTWKLHAQVTTGKLTSPGEKLDSIRTLVAKSDLHRISLMMEKRFSPRLSAFGGLVFNSMTTTYYNDGQKTSLNVHGQAAAHLSEKNFYTVKPVYTFGSSFNRDMTFFKQAWIGLQVGVFYRIKK